MRRKPVDEAAEPLRDLVVFDGHGNGFTVADLIMASVLRLADKPNMIGDFPALVTYRERCLSRPAFKKAVADQLATIAKHSQSDMRYNEVRKSNA